MAARIYVEYLPYTADGQRLSLLFGACGDIVEAMIVMDRDTGQHKGFGLVQMPSDEGYAPMG